MYGTPQGESESLKYSEEVFKNNLKYAIIGQLLNPPEGFEQVNSLNFRCLFKKNLLVTFKYDLYQNAYKFFTALA
jgi:hypothetical protein